MLDGEKRVVLHAPCAAALVVSARTQGEDAQPHGISLFLVDAKGARASTMRRYRTLDELRAADIVVRRP